MTSAKYIILDGMDLNKVIKNLQDRLDKLEGKYPIARVINEDVKEDVKMNTTSAMSGMIKAKYIILDGMVLNEVIKDLKDRLDKLDKLMKM